MVSLDRARTSGQLLAGMSSSDVLFVGNSSDRPRLAPPGSERLTLHARHPSTVHVFGTSSNVTIEHFADIDTTVYLIGRASHAQHSGRELLRFCCDCITRGTLASLRDVYGLFVIVIDDRAQREVTFVSDILGVQPMFVGKHNETLVAGNNVLKIASAGYSGGKANCDAVAAWLKYNHPVAGESVLEGFRKLAPARVCTWRADGTFVSELQYGELEFGNANAAIDDVVDESCDAMRESVRVQTRELREVNLPLSGGYDSRLLAALASQIPSLKLYLATLDTREHESQTAIEVARALGLETRLLPGKKRILDLFDDPFCFTPCGFITGRNLTSFIAQTRPGMPLLSGFLGDGVMRGSLLAAFNAYLAKDGENLPVDDYAQALDKRYTMHGHRLNLLSDRIRKRAIERANAAIRRVAATGLALGRPCIHGDLYCRHRFYFANVVLQHQDIAEGIAPFCNFRSLNCRTRYHFSCFNESNYPRLFEKHFPALAKIPHSYHRSPKATNRQKPGTPPTRHLRRWSADLAAGLLLTDVLNGAKKRRIFTLLPSSLLGEAIYQDEITFLFKLMMFERALQRHSIQFEWEQM